VLRSHTRTVEAIAGLTSPLVLWNLWTQSTWLPQDYVQQPRISSGMVDCVVASPCLKAVAWYRHEMLLPAGNRTRAVVPIGVSAWSGPSATITTGAAPPDPPILSRIPQSDIGYSSVALQWTRGSNNGDPVTAYDVQYRVVGKTEWFEV
jgi:hypothetical protein